MNVRGVTDVRPRRPETLPRRVFTLEHANRTLPLVRRIVGDIVDQHKRVSALEARCDTSDPSLHGAKLETLRRQYLGEIDKLRKLADELTEIGVELKDWRRGLVDFPTVRDGLDAYFCWRLGEERVEFWHDLEAGFPGRQPIDEPPIP